MSADSHNPVPRFGTADRRIRGRLAVLGLCVASMLLPSPLAFGEDSWQARKDAMDAGQEAVARGDAKRLAEIVASVQLTDHNTRELCNAAIAKDCVDCLSVLIGDDAKRCGGLDRMAMNAIRLDASAMVDDLIARGASLDELVQLILEKDDARLARRVLASRGVWSQDIDSGSNARWNPDAPDPAGDTPLTRTLKRRGKGVFEDTLLLLTAGVDPDVSDSNGDQPLVLAAARGRPDLVWALRRHHATASRDTVALAELLWRQYTFEPAVFLGRDEAPRRIDLEVPQGLALAQRTATNPIGERLRGKCCFGFEITIFVHPAASWLGSMASKILHAVRAPAHVSKPAAPFSPSRWDGLSLSSAREPSEVVFSTARRGCYRVDVEVQSPGSLGPEADALARRLMASFRPSPCAVQPIDLGGVVLMATLTAAFGSRVIGRRRRKHQIVRGRRDVPHDSKDAQP